MNKRRRRPAPNRLIRIILLVAIVYAIISNPTKDDFYDWVSNQSLETSESVIEGAFKNLIVSPLLKSVTVRKNYVIYSTFTIEIDDTKMVYVGVYDKFFELKDER